MAQTRPSKAILDKLNERIAWYREKLSDCDKIIAEGNSDLWKTIEKEARRKFEEIEHVLDNYDSILTEKSDTLAKIVALLEARRHQKSLMNSVENAKKNKVAYEKSLVDAIQEKKEYARKLSEYEG